jgi:hypothetical protein
MIRTGAPDKNIGDIGRRFTEKWFDQKSVTKITQKLPTILMAGKL